MNYTLIGNNDYLVDPLGTVLKNRGIEDTDKFLNPTRDCLNDWRLLDNIERAVDCLLEHLEKGSRIYCCIDEDSDGYTSSAFLINYLRDIKPDIDIVYKLREGKIHGFFSKDIPDDVGLVLCADAGTNQIEESQLLYDRDIDLVLLDHHSKDDGVNLLDHKGILVNNQTCDYPNKDLSGVGIVYKFCQAIDERLGVSYADKYLDITALGIVGDSMNMTNLENRYIVQRGTSAKNIKNPLMLAILEKNNYKLKGKVSIKNLGWDFAPLLNSVVRIGTVEEKTIVFKAMLNKESQELVPYLKRGETEPVDVPIYQEAVRLCTNIKAKQVRIRNKVVPKLEKKLEEKNLTDGKILIIDSTEELEHSSMSGVIAIQLAEKYQMPTIVIRKDKEEEGFYVGSGRCYDGSPLESMKDLLNDTGKFEFASGHNSAMGLKAEINNLIEAKEIINERLKDVEFSKYFKVDFKIPSKSISKGLIENLAQYDNVWAKGCEEPKIAIEDIVVSSNDIDVMGENKDTIKFKVGDIEFIKFKESEDRIEELKQNEAIRINVIGTASINNYGGNSTPQIQISDYTWEESKRDMFASF